MTIQELFEAGKVRETQKALIAYLRDHPTDSAKRIFLFELFCFSGDYDRAEKQLAVLAQGSSEAEMGAVVYYAALHAERDRNELFDKQNFSRAELKSPPGKVNGRDFTDFRDADPDIGARLEMFAAGAYMWIPFEHIASVEIEEPRRLRDTLWTPAIVKTAETFKDKDLGEVIIPAIYPFSWKHADEAVWLGRITDWAADEEGREYPSGQKVFLVDGEEVPLLEIRSLEFVTEQDTAPPDTEE